MTNWFDTINANDHIGSSSKNNLYRFFWMASSKIIFESSIRHNVFLRYDKILIWTQIFNLRTKYFLRYEFSFRNNVVRFRVYKCFLGFSMVWHHILFGNKYFGCVIWTTITGHEARTFRNTWIYIWIFNQIKLTTDLRCDYVGLQNLVSLNISFWNSEVVCDFRSSLWINSKDFF